MTNLPPQKLAYIAGIVDGEGTICISRHRKNSQQNWSYGLFCMVVNTHTGMLGWLRDETGLGAVRPQDRKKKEAHWKDKYAWILRVEEMTPFLVQIRPYLIIKNRQAELLREFIRNTRYTGPHYPLTAEEIASKEAIFLEIGSLNHRGRTQAA